MSDKIKVVLSAIWYPMAMATYFWRAFKRRSDVDLFVAGPFTGSWIPWNGGMNLPEKYVVAPDFALPANAIGNNNIPAIILDNVLPWIPDLFVQVDAGWHFALRPRATIVAHVQTDPHVLKATYDLPKSYSDLRYCMQYSYMQEGERFLPYAFDPTVHYPMPDVSKIFDACLLGLHYDHRNALMSALQQKGLNVRYGIGEIFDEFRCAYNQSKVALSWSSLQDIPTRVFEAMGMGLPLVANRLADMSIFFQEGRDYLGFDSVEEGVEQTLGLLADEQFRNKLAQGGHETVQPHTWDARVEQILKDAELI